MPQIVCTFSNLSIEFDARPLFIDLNGSLNRAVSGLVGRNGQGKSVLLKLLSGKLAPTSGSISWFSPHYYVDQIYRLAGERLADALGVGDLFDCFSRIERGEGNVQDLEQVADLWHLPGDWQSLLTSAGLDFSLESKVEQLSGGQRTRLALCAAFLKRDNYLLLDEPTNHLDRQGRDWLLQCLSRHPGGALVVSHDRMLLREVETIFELNSFGLTEYGGNYDLYLQKKTDDIAATERKVDSISKEMRKIKQRQQQSLQKADRRCKQGEQLRKSGSQSKLLMNAKKESAQRNLSKLKQQHESHAERLSEKLQENEQRLEQIKSQRLKLTTQGLRGGLRLYLNELVLPWLTQAPITLSVYSGERWRVSGNNGSGKSTLLKVINGQIEPVAGLCQRHGSCLYLDQHFSLLDEKSSAVENLHRIHPDISLTDWRTRLASLRLRGDKALLPVGALSGGERLKVALLAVTGGFRAPDLLLLDEPENHLDLDSRILLEQALRDYPGALMIVSHDEEFIKNIGIDFEVCL